MALPLPNYIKNNIADNQTPNLSLKYYKRAEFYNHDFTGFEKNTGDKKPKVDFLNTFIDLSKQNAYKEAFETRKRLMESIGICFSMTTASRLVFGIGYQHPTEIGFMFDWTSGLPIIPGSSLKGVTKDAAETNEHECIIKKIFGSKKEDRNVCSGEIIFFPAYPCLADNSKFLELDVMTPHYSKYYSDSANNPPADWHSPIPLHFLTVPAGIKYCFRLAHRNNLKGKESPLLIKAVNILKYALTEFGVGAKTAVSYGYFK